uniref:PH domain-containing protein n=1 Tax=Setaria digitata TaxID=48799 RepID=A0A915Q840_9BILA
MSRILEGIFIKRILSSDQLDNNSCGGATSATFAETTSSAFYAPNHSASTSVHVPTATHRIQRFISFFSSNDSQVLLNLDLCNQDSPWTKHWEATISSATVRLPSRRRLKRSTTATTEPICASSVVAPVVRLSDVQKQGQLMHQEVAMGEQLKNDRHKWTACWAVLHSSKLYLCSQLSSYTSDETHEKLLNIPSDSRTIDLKSAIVDIAYEYWRPKDSRKSHVFRVITQQQTEHHFQAYCEDDMLKWIEIIRVASSCLISSQSDHGTVSSGVTSNSLVSSNSENKWLMTNLESADPNGDVFWPHYFLFTDL